MSTVSLCGLGKADFTPGNYGGHVTQAGPVRVLLLSDHRDCFHSSYMTLAKPRRILHGSPIGTENGFSQGLLSCWPPLPRQWEDLCENEAERKRNGWLVTFQHLDQAIPEVLPHDIAYM